MATPLEVVLMFLALHSVTVAHGAEDVPNLCPEAVAENMLSASQHWQPLQSIKDFCNGTLTSLGNPVAYNGNSKLVWEFFRRAATGQRLSVVILGGSVAACHATGGHDSPQCWSFMLQTWFAMHFPRVNVTNRAMPATTSSYAARCVANLVPEDVDLVIIEFALNDYSEDRHSAEVSQFLSQQTAPSCDLGAKANRLGYERLVRKLALWPSRPAIIGLQFWSDNMGDAAFWKTSEDEIETVLKYYQVPSLSYRGTYYDAVVDGCPCFSHAAAYADFSHPNQLGNSYLARVVTMYFEQTLVTMPRLKGARSFPSTPPKVPTKPMFPGNEVGDTFCIAADGFRRMAVASGDWQWEDSDKPGFYSDVPGSVLNITYPLDAAQGNISVALAHLKSYHSVGTALVSCSGRCMCDAWLLQAYHEDQTSQTYFAHFDGASVEATGTANCTISIEVRQDTKTDGHRVKVSAFSWEEGHTGNWAGTSEPGVNVWNKGEDHLSALS